MLQSGWDEQTKQQWIGKNYRSESGAAANDIVRTNVPNARCEFRHLLLSEERNYVKSLGNPMYIDGRSTTPLFMEDTAKMNSGSGGSSKGIQSKIDGLIAMFGDDGVVDHDAQSRGSCTSS